MMNILMTQRLLVNLVSVTSAMPLLMILSMVVFLVV